MNRDVRLQVEGSLLERLVEQALKEGAVFARIRRTGPRAMLTDTDARSADILTGLCRRYGYSCRTLRRGGKTALEELIRSRWTVLPGLILGIIICLLFLSRIWMVDVAFTGPNAQAGRKNAVLACLEKNGLRTGMAAWEIDTDLLQKQLMAEIGDCSFIGVRRQGIRLLVEASPEVDAPQLYAIEQPRDLVAARNGVVESITVYSGEACVKPGDTVLAGEVLIRGEEALTKEETTPVGARGEVIARCWYEGSAEGMMQSVVETRTGKTETGVRLTLLGLSLPLSKCEGFAREEIETEFLPVVGLFLPLQIERSTHWETVAETREADLGILEDRLATLARADAQARIASNEDACEIASSWTDAKQNGNTLQIRAVYEIYADIAAERDAPIEEVY